MTSPSLCPPTEEVSSHPPVPTDLSLLPWGLFFFFFFLKKKAFPTTPAFSQRFELRHLDRRFRHPSNTTRLCARHEWHEPRGSSSYISGGFVIIAQMHDRTVPIHTSRPMWLLTTPSLSTSLFIINNQARNPTNSNSNYTGVSFRAEELKSKIEILYKFQPIFFFLGTVLHIKRMTLWYVPFLVIVVCTQTVCRNACYICICKYPELQNIRITNNYTDAVIPDWMDRSSPGTYEEETLLWLTST